MYLILNETKEKVKSVEIEIKNEKKPKSNQCKIKWKFSTQPRAATTSMHCAHRKEIKNGGNLK